MTPELTIAIPRGALLEDTLALLDNVGIDTTDVRAGDRRLQFAGGTMITMRPSDVPTYVASGAADIGITGKDVLREHDENAVIEVRDLRFGGCRMVLASVDEDPDPIQEALRRHGIVRVATKYPKTAIEYFRQTGRQVEIVEVRGSVELAPLTRMAEAIVDLTATGTTMRENGLVVREELHSSTARLIANRVAYRLKAAAIDRLLARIDAGVNPGTSSAVDADEDALGGPFGKNHAR